MGIDWSSFLPTLLATFVGLGGVFILNEIHHKNVEKKRARRLLILLKKDVELNDNLLSQLREALIQNNIVFYNLSFVVWNSFPSNIITLLNNSYILKDISDFYYQLQHVSRKVDMIFSITYSSKMNQETLKRRQELITSLNQHIPAIFEGRICKSPQTIMAQIDCLIRELK